VQRPLTRRNPKRCIPLLSLLLWRKMVPFHLGSRLATVVSEAVSEAVINFWQFFLKILPVGNFVFLKIYFMLDGIIICRKGDFRSEVYKSLGWFLKAAF